MNKIPRTFCVTLRETPKRKAFAAQYFKEIGLDVEMFDGVNGKTFGLKTTVPNYSVVPGREYFITQGAVGCLLSHLTLWNILLHQPEDEFLIIEDDALFCENFEELFVKFKNELPSDWDVAYVGWFQAKNEFIEKPPLVVNDHIIVANPVGTHAYLVKKSALKTLIETNQIAWHTIDMQMLYRSFPKLKHYLFKTSLVVQRSTCDATDNEWGSLCHDYFTSLEWIKKTQKNSIGLGAGWYPLEKNDDGYMVWSDGRGEFLFDEEWETMEIEFIVEGSIEKKIKIICPLHEDREINIKSGLQTISFPICGSKSVVVVSDTFKPIDVYKTSDYRSLGIRFLKGIKLTDKVGKKTFVSLYSMYNQKKINETTKTDSFQIVKTKYSHDDGKINMTGQISFPAHRSGWGHVLNILAPYHREDATLFDGWLERTFTWQREEYSQIRLIPYREPWIGVIHNPPSTPAWFSPNANPTSMIHTREFQESLATCRGIYALSNHLAKFLRCFMKNTPIETLYLPTETPDVKFSYPQFIENTNKKVLSLGWWCRNLSSIYQLEVDPDVYQKVMVTQQAPTYLQTIEHIMSIEAMMNGTYLLEDQKKSVVNIRHMPNEEYDELLSKNVVFMELYDSSANNVIVECMARGTPVLVNPLPAVVEYLGEDYPFYFTTHNQAASKLNNMAIIKETHEYLVNSGVAKKVTEDYFLKTLRSGIIWKSLP